MRTIGLAFFCFWAALGSTLGPTLEAHESGHPSVQDTVAAVLKRMRKTLQPEELKGMDARRAEEFLTAEERLVLGTEHVSFRVNQPVTVWVVEGPAPKEEPFWLREQGFAPVDQVWSISGTKVRSWKKEFPAGRVGLGVNSLSGGGLHYAVFVQPRPVEGAGAAVLVVSDLYPGQLRAEPAVSSLRPYADREEKVEIVSPELSGATVVRTLHGSRSNGQLLNRFLFTEHRASARPDQIVLTWADDPQRTQSIQWRTDTSVQRGAVRFARKADFNPLASRSSGRRLVRAKTERIEAPLLVNDPVIHHHTARLEGLEPGTTYVYTVGQGKHWSEPAEFTTAPGGVAPFSFVYMGDAQNGLDRWGTLLKNAYRERPDAAFYLMAGDLVDRGGDRDDWDSFLDNSAGVFDRRQLVPVLGNHEYQGGEPGLYLQLFDLLRNGPESIGPERAYSFEYSNALFVILDSNLSPEAQAPWLEARLAETKAKWKFVAFHHPAYSSAPKRDNPAVREVWGPIFDRYHVDLALQGHDHAYLRTHPMKGHARVEKAEDGTIYVVAVSGTKMYDQAERDYTAMGMTKVATYQVLDIQVSGDRLVYRAWDIDGKIRDEFVIEK